MTSLTRQPQQLMTSLTSDVRDGVVLADVITAVGTSLLRHCGVCVTIVTTAYF